MMPLLRSHFITASLAAALLLFTSAASAQNILFVCGADRSGGFLEAGDDAARTEHLGDIENASTDRGNHGWNELATLLTDHGYTLTQVCEAVEPGNTAGQSQGVAVDFAAMDLDQYDAIVFGSNNAEYSEAQVDAIEAYLRAGGGAVFISDTNFGSDWADAPNSDQAFLGRFGLTINQDHGTYDRDRAKDELLLPDHPIFEGVDRFDGEGVTPITVGDDIPEGVSIEILASAEGHNVRRNRAPFGNKNLGPTTQATAQDAVLLTATIGKGRLITHFDRNTFFNQNGAGTNINRLDNARPALNLFAWLTGIDVDEEAADGEKESLGWPTKLRLNRYHDIPMSSD